MKRSYSRKNLRLKSRRSKRRMNGGKGRFKECIAELDTRDSIGKSIKFSSTGELIDSLAKRLTPLQIIELKNKAIQKAKSCAWSHDDCQTGSADNNCIKTLNTIEDYEKRNDLIIIKGKEYDLSKLTFSSP